jgi:hypothetical protein
LSASGERIRRRLANLRQNASIGVMQRFRSAVYHHNRIFVVRLRAVGIDRDHDVILDG